MLFDPVVFSTPLAFYFGTMGLGFQNLPMAHAPAYVIYIMLQSLLIMAVTMLCSDVSFCIICEFRLSHIIVSDYCTVVTYLRILT